MPSVIVDTKRKKIFLSLPVKKKARNILLFDITRFVEQQECVRGSKWSQCQRKRKEGSRGPDSDFHWEESLWQTRITRSGCQTTETHMKEVKGRNKSGGKHWQEEKKRKTWQAFSSWIDPFTSPLTGKKESSQSSSKHTSSSVGVSLSFSISLGTALRKLWCNRFWEREREITRDEETEWGKRKTEEEKRSKMRQREKKERKEEKDFHLVISVCFSRYCFSPSLFIPSSSWSVCYVCLSLWLTGWCYFSIALQLRFLLLLLLKEKQRTEGKRNLRKQRDSILQWNGKVRE